MTQFFAWLGRGVDWLIERVGVLPTTQLRTAITLLLVIGTGAVYLALAVKSSLIASAKPWIPDPTWLGFLTLMSGLDGATFFAKRTTDANYVAAKQSGTPATTTTTTSPPGSVTTTTEPSK